MNLKYTSIAALLSITLSGCGTFSILDEVVPDNTKEYLKAETMPPLDVPPDLSAASINDDIVNSTSTSATYSEFKEEAENPLASKYNIIQDIKPALTGEGATRHLIVPNSQEPTWEHLASFVDEKGLRVKRSDQRIGLMDTEPGADSYAYRLRIERGDTTKQTLVYVSAAGMENDSQKNEAMLRQVAGSFGELHQQEKEVLQERVASLPPEAVTTTLVDEGSDQSFLPPEAVTTTLVDEGGDQSFLPPEAVTTTLVDEGGDQSFLPPEAVTTTLVDEGGDQSFLPPEAVTTTLVDEGGDQSFLPPETVTTTLIDEGGDQSFLPPEAVTTALIDEGGHQSILVEQDFPDVWKRVGRVLDSKGFKVEERDPSSGTYLLHYIDLLFLVHEEESLLSRLAFRRDDVDKIPEEFYNIKLISDAENTRIIILDAEGTISVSDISKRLLTLLQEQLT
jgi:uncharacterized lipoprotein